MIDIVTYINEGGFFTNTGANKYIDMIKNFGNIISTKAVQKELSKASFVSKMPETKVYKKLYDLFNDVNKYEVKFDIIHSFPTGGTCNEHWVGTRSGNKFSLLCERIFGKQSDNNTSLYEYKDASEFLSQILYRILYTCKLDVLRNTAKFTIK